MIAKSRMSLAEFLALPEEKPYREYIAGQAVPKAMPNEDHASIAGILGVLWYLAAKQARTHIRFGQELRLTLPLANRVFVPDFFVRLLDPATGSSLAGRSYPELVVEILSPEDRPSRLGDKVDVYLQAGLVLWVIDPRYHTVSVHIPGAPPVEYVPGEEIPLDPIVPGATIAVDDIFAAMPPAEA